MSNSFKDRIVGFEVPPPSSAWNNIADELAMSKELTDISNKLYNYSVTPPADSWSLIKSSIKSDNQDLASLYSLKPGKMAIILRMAAVAAMLGVIIMGILYFRKVDGSISALVTNQPSSISKEETRQEEAIKKNLSAPWEPDTEEFSEAPVASAFKTNKIRETDNRILQKTIVKNTFLLTNESQMAIAAKPIRNAKGEIIQNPEIIDSPVSQYISVTSPNGQQTKISSKFVHVLLFLNDDSDIDQVDGYFDKNFLESLTWKSRFKEWRNEIMHTPFIPSSANFMDILDFKDLISKDK